MNKVLILLVLAVFLMGSHDVRINRMLFEGEALLTRCKTWQWLVRP